LNAIFAGTAQLVAARTGGFFMLNQRRAAAIKVAEGLFALERAIDEALSQAAELNRIMPQAWAEANLSCVVGQEAFDGAAAVFATLAKARRQVVETHGSLNDTKVRIGLRTLSFGDGTTKPPPKGMLSVVDSDESRAA
jgi:hypothetical protein